MTTEREVTGSIPEARPLLRVLSNNNNNNNNNNDNNNNNNNNNIYYLVLRKLTYIKWSNAYYKLLKLTKKYIMLRNEGIPFALQAARNSCMWHG